MASANHRSWHQWLSGLLGLGIWLSLGLLGNYWLASVWRESQYEEFRRSIQLVSAWASTRNWSGPIESDQQWLEMEQRLAIDLVPLLPTSNKSDAAISKVEWLRTPAGLWQVSVTEALPDSNPRLRAIRGTRVFNQRPLDIVWWIVWSLMNAVMLVPTWRRKRQLVSTDSEIRELLQPWHDSSGVDGTLPPISEAASSAAVWLNEIGQRINAKRSALNDRLAQYHLVLENLSEGVLAVDQLGRVFLTNSALRKQLEITDETLQLRPIVEVVRLPRVIELIDHVLQNGNASQQTIEVGATTRYLHLLAAPLPMAEHQRGVVVLVSDVSSDQRSELARREFIAGASHELKTPLAAIRAYTETLQSIGDEDPEASERFLSSILLQADRMDRLVSGMLQLARAESGALKMKIDRIDAVASLRPCLEAAKGMAQSKNLSIRESLPGHQVWVMADRDAFQTIASNLLSNAVRYTPDSGQIEVELTQEDRWICLKVSDTGIGISEADQERIFERFYRVQKDRALDSGGTGLGLAIVKQLTNVLDGSVKVISRKGVGTSFEIRLPAVGFTQSSSNNSGEAAGLGR